MKKPKNPFRSTLRRRIRKMLSKAGRNIQSRLKPTTRDQCRGILVSALVIVLISSLIVLFVQSLIYFLRILFSELSGLCVFLAPSVHDHISRFSPDDFVFLIPVRLFSFIIVLICFFFFEGWGIVIFNADHRVLAGLWIGLSGSWTFHKTSLCFYVG